MSQQIWDCVNSPGKPVSVIKAVDICKRCDTRRTEGDPEPQVAIAEIRESGPVVLKSLLNAPLRDVD